MALQVAEFPPQLPASFSGIPLNGGRTHAISIHPHDRRTALISTQFGGLWRTTSGGDAWQHVSGLPAVFTADVQFGLEGRTVVATRFWDLQRDNGGGIWVSRDAGVTWTRPRSGAVPTDARTPDRTAAWGIAKAPDDDGTWYVGTDYGIAISRDNAASWSHARPDPAAPLLGDRMQDSVRSVLAFPNGQALAMTRTRVYRSDDRGVSWRIVRTGSFTFWEGAGWNKMDRSPYWPYAFVLENYETLHFYELGADRWTTLTLPAGGGSRSPFVRTAKANISGDYTTIWVGQGVRAIFATRKRVGSIRALQPEDWSIIGRGEGIHDDTGDLGVDAGWKPVMLGSDGGVFKPKTADILGNITQWTSAAPPGSRFNSYQITDLGGTNVLHPERTVTSVYFSTQDNAIWASTDGGNTWPTSDCAEGFHVEVRTTAGPDDKVTVAYGKVGCGPSGSMFSDAGLANQRAVPDLDQAGTAQTNWGQAFYLKGDYWIRFRSPMTTPPSPGEIWVSSNNGANWRRRFTTTFGPTGPFQRSKSHYPASYMKAYLSVVTGATNPDGSARIGLVRLYSLTKNRVDAIGAGQIITLPNNGSLGVRATEFDWQAVFGVHPKEWRLIVAPDIVNGDVKISRNGGETFASHAQLTNLVTKGGSLEMYRGQYHMQVTHIGFDPYHDDRIMVGTRDAGIIVSDDAGATWTTIPGSERVLYPTGFFFLPDTSVFVSTYGRGLWRITQALGCLPLAGSLQGRLTGLSRFVARDTKSNEFVEESIAEADAMPDDEDEQVPAADDEPGIRRIVVRTPFAQMGAPVLDESREVQIWAIGFDPGAAPPAILLDGAELPNVLWEADRDGAIWTNLRLDDDLARGEHRIEVRQGSGDNALVATASVIKVELDDHLGERPFSRIVEQPLEPDGDDQDDEETLR